jgi:translation initiation factor IF-2
MGHIDHGKSTLLDYIRKTHVVEGEAGGITQHISAYEAVIKDEDGTDRKITFLDTPGHEAFSAMRRRGAGAADIAILVVAADDGVNTQTKEAYEAIEKAEIPIIVAINKIDKPGADAQKTKNSLVENAIYIEGYGGKIPFSEVSAKTGEGIDELLSTIVLMADLEELSYDPSQNATGVILESNVDVQKGLSSTLIIRDGVLKSGDFVVAGVALAPTRIMENFAGQKIKEAHAGMPVNVVGFSSSPDAGELFEVTTSKKDAENKAAEFSEARDAIEKRGLSNENVGKELIPIIIKTDTVGTRDAVLDELKKLEHERVALKVLNASTGQIGENDVSMVAGTLGGVVIGFHTSPDKRALRVAEDEEVEIATFEIIYELIGWTVKLLERRAPKIDVEESHGKAKVLKIFSQMKNKQVIGIRLDEGTMKKGDKVNILRRENEIGKATILELRHGKEITSSISAPGEFGARIESKLEVTAGDYLEPYKVVTK